MPEQKGWLNAYECEKGHIIYTVHRDSGTTPMFMSCKTCGERSTSKMGIIPPEHPDPTHEWYKPSRQQCEGEAKFYQKAYGGSLGSHLKGILEHVSHGGLLIRLIADRGEESGEAEQVKTPEEQHQAPSKNAPCPCGSGKKYKRCCGKPE